MSRSIRSLLVLLLALAVSFAVMPVPALADAPAVVITWERNWGSYGPADGQFSGPLDVAVDKWGHVYVTGVTDVADRRVQVFTSDGTFIGKTTEGWDGQPLSSPRSVACDRWGSVYVGQEGNGGLVNRYQALLTLPSPPFDESLG